MKCYAVLAGPAPHSSASTALTTITVLAHSAACSVALRHRCRSAARSPALAYITGSTRYPSTCVFFIWVVYIGEYVI